MHAYYLGVDVRFHGPDGVTVETHDPITTRNGLAEAINAAARLLEADPQNVMITHHIDLTPPLSADTPDGSFVTNDQMMTILALLRDAYGPLAPAPGLAARELLNSLPRWLRVR